MLPPPSRRLNMMPCIQVMYPDCKEASSQIYGRRGSRTLKMEETCCCKPTTLHVTRILEHHETSPYYSPDFPTPPCPRTITLRGFWREHKLILQKEDLGEEDVVISWWWWWGFCWLDKILWSTVMLACCCHHVTSRSALISLPATR